MEITTRSAKNGHDYGSRGDHQPPAKRKRIETKEKLGTDKWLSGITRDMGKDWFAIGITLGYSCSQLEQLEMTYVRQPRAMMIKMLRKWWDEAICITHDMDRTAQIMANCFSEENKACAEMIHADHEDAELTEEIQEAISKISFDLHVPTGQPSRSETSRRGRTNKENPAKQIQIKSNPTKERRLGIARNMSSIDQCSTATVPREKITTPNVPYFVSALTDRMKKCAGCEDYFDKPIREPEDFTLKHNENIHGMIRIYVK